MASEIPAKVEEASKKFKEVVETLGKNYLAAVVAGAFVPVLQDGVNAMLDEVKGAAGAKAEEDGDIKGLAEDPEEKEADAILVAVAGLKPITTRYNTKFMAYSTFTIRIGSVGEEKAKAFYVNARRYDVRYSQLKRAPEKAKSDFKDLKAPDFPEKYEFGGSYCLCLTKAPGDVNAHLKAVQDYFPALTKALPGYSDKLASHFKIGNSYESQQTAFELFTEAYNNTRSDLGLSTLSRDIPPFDEVEALIVLLQGVADKDILPGLLSSIEGDNAMAIRLRDSARSSVLGAIDAAAEGWAPLSEAASKAGVKVVEKVKEGAEKILDALKPALEKVVNLIQEKMAEKAEGKEEEEEKVDTSPKIGDIASKWQFHLTAIGKEFHGNLATKKPSEAIAGSTEAILKALDAGVRGPLEKISDSLLGGGSSAVKKIVAKEINKITNKITSLITELTTLDGFLAAGKVLGEVVDKIEGKLEEKDVADKASHDLWIGVSHIAMELYQRIYSLKDKVEAKFSGVPEEATEVVTGLLDHIFEVQLRAFNGIRIQYVRNLKASLGDAKDKTEASRAALRTAIFSTIDLLGAHHWVKAFEALAEASKIIIIDFFQQNIWPPIKSGLEAIQSMLPSELCDLGLKIEPMAWKVVVILLTKGIDWALNKVFLAIEAAIFTQKAEGGY